jgi:hypothetical protein
VRANWSSKSIDTSNRLQSNKSFIVTINGQLVSYIIVMENNELNDVGEEDEEEDNFVPDDEDEEEEDEEESDDEEEEDDVNAARRHDGVLEGGVAEPSPETGKSRRIASQADIVRTGPKNDYNLLFNFMRVC